MNNSIQALLVCDEQAIVRQIRPLVDYLETVDGPAAALAACRHRAPELVLVHLGPDYRTDLKCVRQIKQDCPDTVVIALSTEKNADLFLAGLRAGVADFLGLPVPEKAFRQAVRRVWNRQNPATQALATTAALFSLKGGQGVTSLAVNLADQMQRSTKGKVLLLDLNLYLGQIGLFLNMPVGYTPFDLLRDIERIDENLLFSSLTRHPRGFYVLAAPEEISDADQIRGPDVARMLKILRHHFDTIVVDLPHDLSERSLAVLDVADHLLLVTTQGITALKSTQRILAFLRELNYDDHKVKIVLSRHQSNSDLGLDELENILQQPVFATVSHDPRTLRQTAKNYQTAAQARPKSRLNRDLQHLGRRLAGTPDNVPAPSGLKGLFRKMRSHEAQ